MTIGGALGMIVAIHAIELPLSIVLGSGMTALCRYANTAPPAIYRSLAMILIRALTVADHSELLEIYGDAVASQAPGPYSDRQVRAWLGQLGPGGGLAATLKRGSGLVSCAQSGEIEAFALMEPPDRLSLLYCRGRAARQGHATGLLQRLERLAQAQGIGQLRTEASQLSRPLLQRQGWTVAWLELLLIDGIPFRRYRMTKSLVALP